jgi:hypothetical protein
MSTQYRSRRERSSIFIGTLLTLSRVMPNSFSIARCS